ncbi:MAG: IS21-like element helper ATPase IstB [Planctomycetales bacterium]|nr:IS21-like element helper ATPase IstB [Planctomycetales bacterium]MCA9169000.1 IS21-like element helper ATPase IstB [Planctomycetales bacterium]
MTNQNLTTALRKLRLSGLLNSLEMRLHEATAAGLSHVEFLELILQDELLVRGDRQIQRRITQASFRDQRRIEDFDFSFNPSIKRSHIYELASCRFIHEHRDLLLIGPPGTGKSHLVQGLGLAAIRHGFLVYYRSIFDVVRDFLADEALEGHERTLQRYLKPDLLIIDDMGIKQLPKRSGEFLFEIIMRRYELRSTMMTSNRPIGDWGKLLGDVPAATAILDRFLHRAEILEITGRSYRLHDRQESSKGTKAPTAPADDTKRASKPSKGTTSDE